MRSLLIAALILLLLFLISLIRIGGSLEYGANGPTIQIGFGIFRVTVYPRRKKTDKKAVKKGERGKRKKELRAEEPPGGPGGLTGSLKEFISLVTNAAGRMKRKVRVDRLYLDLTIGMEDAAAAAMSFGGANAALGMICPLLEHHFNIKDRRIRTRVDFLSQATVVYLYAAFSFTLGQSLALGGYLAVRFLKLLSHAGKGREKKQKEAV